MRRKTFDLLVSTGGLVLAAVLLVAGGLLMWGYPFAGAGLILILSLAGLVHGRRVTADAEVLGQAVRTSPAST